MKQQQKIDVFTFKDIEIIPNNTKNIIAANQTKELAITKKEKILAKVKKNFKRVKTKSAFIIVEENLSLTEKANYKDDSSTAGIYRWTNRVFKTKEEAFNFLKKKYENDWIIGKKTCHSLTIDDRELLEDKQEVHLRKSFWSYYPNPSPIPSAWYKYSIEEIKGIDDIDKHNARQFEIAKKYFEDMEAAKKNNEVSKDFEFGNLEEYIFNYWRKY